MDILYLRDFSASVLSFMTIDYASALTMTPYIYSLKVEQDPPPLCDYDQVYNGIECVTEFKQLFSDSQQQHLDLLIPTVSDTFSASVWVLFKERVGVNQERIVYFSNRDETAQAGLFLSHAAR